MLAGMKIKFCFLISVQTYYFIFVLFVQTLLVHGISALDKKEYMMIIFLISN